MPAQRGVLVTSHHSVAQTLYRAHRGETESIFAADVEVLCAGGYIPAHSIILGAASPVLREHFKHQSPFERERMLVLMPEYDISDVTPVLISFYSGSCTFACDQLPRVLDIFEQFGICTNSLNFRNATEEDLKKKGFIRRFLDVGEDDDYDDGESALIEDGERVTMEDIPHEVRENLFNRAPSNGGPESDATESAQKKKPTHQFVKVRPQLQTQAAKVHRDGVTGVKEGGRNDEESSSSDEDDEKSTKSEKKGTNEIENNDENNPDDSVEDNETENCDRASLGTAEDNASASPPKKKKVQFLVAETDSESDDAINLTRNRKARKIHSSSSDESEDGDEESGQSDVSEDVSDDDQDLSSGEDYPIKHSLRNSQALKLSRRRQRTRSKSAANRESSESRKVQRRLRKRTKQVKYHEQLNEYADEEEQDESPKQKRRRTGTESPRSDNDSSDPTYKSSDTSDSDTPHSPVKEASPRPEPVTKKGHDIEDSEFCYLPELEIRLKKLSPSVFEKYQQKQQRQLEGKDNEQEEDSDEAKQKSTEVASEHVEHTNIATTKLNYDKGKYCDNRDNIVNERVREQNHTQKASIEKFKKSGHDKTSVNIAGRASSSESQPKTLPSQKTASPPVSQKKSVKVNTQNDQDKHKRQELDNCDSLPGHSKLSTLKTSSGFITPLEATKATKSCISKQSSCADQSVWKNTSEKTNHKARQKWWVATKTCQVCNTVHRNHAGASRCLKKHQYDRCWLCLQIFKSSEFNDHCETHDSKSSKCPVCDHNVSQKHVQSHMTTQHFSGFSGVESSDPESPTKSNKTRKVDSSNSSEDVSDDDMRPLVRIKPPNQLFESDQDEDDANDVPQSASGSGDLPQIFLPEGTDLLMAAPSSTATSIERTKEIRVAPESTKTSWLEEQRRITSLVKSSPQFSRNTGEFIPSTHLPTSNRTGRITEVSSTNPQVTAAGSSLPPVTQANFEISNVTRFPHVSRPNSLMPTVQPTLSSQRNVERSLSQESRHTSLANSRNVFASISSRSGNERPSSNSAHILSRSSNAVIHPPIPTNSCRVPEVTGGIGSATTNLLPSLTNAGNPSGTSHISGRNCTFLPIHNNPNNFAGNLTSANAPVVPDSTRMPVAAANPVASASSSEVDPSRTREPVAAHIAAEMMSLLARQKKSHAGPPVNDMQRIQLNERPSVQQSGSQSVRCAGPSAVQQSAEKALLVSSSSCTSTSASMAVLSSRPAFPGRRHDAQNINSAESALVPYQSHQNAEISLSSAPALPAMSSEPAEASRVPPSTGPIILNSRSLGRPLIAPVDPQFIGSTTIEGVPFRVYSRPRAADAAPSTLVSVSHDRIHPGRLTQRSPMNSLPAGPSGGTKNGVTTEAASSSVQQFQAGVNQAESVAVNKIHRSVNMFSENYVQQQRENTERSQVTQAVAVVNGGARYRCEDCDQDFDMQESLSNHLCFGVD